MRCTLSDINRYVLGCLQVRVLSASMTIRQMFSGREQFRVLITDHVRTTASITCPPLPCLPSSLHAHPLGYRALHAF